jgi:hypothetical protein
MTARTESQYACSFSILSDSELSDGGTHIMLNKTRKKKENIFKLYFILL